MQPSEFWELTPYQWQVIFKDYKVKNGIGKKKQETAELKKLFELPEARPTKSIVR